MNVHEFSFQSFMGLFSSRNKKKTISISIEHNRYVIRASMQFIDGSKKKTKQKSFNQF